MRQMIFIPAIDLIDGKCVRLHQGDYTKKTIYSENPVEVAAGFAHQGARCIHIVDLDAARDGKGGNLPTIERIIQRVHVPVQVGGGVRDEAKIRALLDAGADRVILGTVVLRDEKAVRKCVEKYGERLAASIDAKNGYVRISGWREGSSVTAVELGKKVKNMGFSLIIHTDIGMDGTMEGPNIPEVFAMASATGLPLIVAGGISSIEDIQKVKSLEQHGVIGVIAGRALYEGVLSVREACAVLNKGNQEC
jgi:phosphoribosylformimino-5-aminoimidazole carboxamide ribotide isomerase